MAVRGDADDVRIRRVSAISEIWRVAESDERPRLAAVGGFEDAVAVRDVAANRILTGADVDDVGVGQIAMAPIVPPKYLSVIGAHVIPPSVVLNTPPPVVPR